MYYYAVLDYAIATKRRSLSGGLPSAWQPGGVLENWKKGGRNSELTKRMASFSEASGKDKENLEQLSKIVFDENGGHNKLEDTADDPDIKSSLSSDARYLSETGQQDKRVLPAVAQNPPLTQVQKYLGFQMFLKDISNFYVRLTFVDPKNTLFNNEPDEYSVDGSLFVWPVDASQDRLCGGRYQCHPFVVLGDPDRQGGGEDAGDSRRSATIMVSGSNATKCGGSNHDDLAYNPRSTLPGTSVVGSGS